jgi:sugar phosphate isomerase/epimerase
MKTVSTLNRRNFLQTTSMATVGMSLAGTWDRAEAAARKEMFISLNFQAGWYAPSPGASTLAAGGTTTAGAAPAAVHPRVGWPEMAQLAAKLGYGGAGLPLAAAMQDGAEKTRALYSDLKLRPDFFNMPASPFASDDATFQKSMEHLDEACAFAVAVDCPRALIVMQTSSDTPKDEYRKIALDRARAMSEVMNRYKVRVGLEFLGPHYFRSRKKYEFMTAEPEVLEFCKDAGPNWGLVLDTWHWYHSGSTIDEIVSAGKERIVTVHISDAKKMPPDDVRDNMRLFPGEGDIDLIGIFQALKKIGYEDGVMPETLGRVPESWTPEQAAKAALDSTRAVLNKAGIKA